MNDIVSVIDIVIDIVIQTLTWFDVSSVGSEEDSILGISGAKTGSNIRWSFFVLQSSVLLFEISHAADESRRHGLAVERSKRD